MGTFDRVRNFARRSDHLRSLARFGRKMAGNLKRTEDLAHSLIARAPGYRSDQWVRVVQIDEWKHFLTSKPLASLTALEISPGLVSMWREIGFGSYNSVDYPEFDITKQRIPEQFDVIIAEQVFEHLRYPYAAARNVRAMLKDDGVFLIATPFLIRVHGQPNDYTRWTPDGLKAFLEDCGFDAEVRSWGNRKAVVANFRKWAEYGWGRGLKNEYEFPTVVWGYARKAPLAAK
jgi:SAM-dependent methyltransferase